MSAIEQLKSGLTVGHFGLGLRGMPPAPGTPKQQVHDGDTISVTAKGNFSVRFLGIDTPEVSFHLPDKGGFPSISSSEWQDFLSDPFAAEYKPLNLDPGLKSYLLNKLGKNKSDRREAALNHARHAELAQRNLEGEVETDQQVTGPATFEFFLTFAHEVTDRYGRLLAYINRKDSSPNRPRDYNLRQLEKGVACPYSIWPNVGEGAGYDSLMKLILQPGTANTWATKDRYLKFTRDKVMAARTAKIGIFNASDPLRLEPFELRFLADRRAPERWVIDLSQNDSTLIAPQNYYQIDMENRLFVPAEFVPLFEMEGWKRQIGAAYTPKIATAAKAS